MKHDVVLSVETAIRLYRKYAQKKIKMINDDLTLDQSYILKLLSETPDITQVEMADTMNKDYASMSRMIDSLVDKKYLKRIDHKVDKRRSQLKLSPKAKEALEIIAPAIEYNQQQAFKGISEMEVNELNRVLRKIAVNCEEML